MTLGDTTVEDIDLRARAFGYGQRRSWVFWAWWYGMTLAITGWVDAGLSGLLGQNMDRGIFIVVLGGIISAVGWLLTLGVRFSKKPPKPASDIPRVEQGIRIAPMVVKFSLIATVLILAALTLLTPRGLSLEVLPITGLVAASLLSITGGMGYTGWLMKNSGKLYERWLERRARTGYGTS